MENGECGVWSVESAKCVENEEYGKHGVRWKMRSMENVECVEMH